MRVIVVLMCTLAPTGQAAAKTAWSTESEQAPPGLLLRNVRIVDAAAGVTGPPTDVLVLGERIVAIGRDIDAGIMPVVQGNARFLMPGLIDTHVHLSSLPDAMRDIALRRTLEGGVTRVRDMGGHGPMLVGLRERSVAAVANRDQARARPAIHCVAVVAGPTWMAADARAAASAGEGEPGTQPWLAAIDDAEQAAGIVDAAAGFGVDGLKLYADMDPEVVAALSAEGRERGLAVWSHATIFPARPDAVVAAGVQAVSHAEMLFFTADATVPARYHAAEFGGRDTKDAEHPAVMAVLDQMAAAGTMLEPTLTVTEVRRSRELIDADHVAATHALVRGADERGVPILAGTDLMISPGTDGPNIHLELELLVDKAGLSPAAALRGATTHAAALLGAEGELGLVAPGAIADLVLLERDPLEDISATRAIMLVIRGGLVVEPTPREPGAPIERGDAGAHGRHRSEPGEAHAAAQRRVAAMNWFGDQRHAGHPQPGAHFSRFFDDPFCVCADVMQSIPGLGREPHRALPGAATMPEGRGSNRGAHGVAGDSIGPTTPRSSHRTTRNAITITTPRPQGMPPCHQVPLYVPRSPYSSAVGGKPTDGLGWASGAFLGGFRCGDCDMHGSFGGIGSDPEAYARDQGSFLGVAVAPRGGCVRRPHSGHTA